MSIHTKLHRAIHAAILSGVAVAASMGTPAHAQATDSSNSDDARTLQTIMVTGSHIRRVDVETSNPVITISTQQLQQTGFATVGEVVRELPSLIGVGSSPQVNNGAGAGATRVGVRSLGPQRTLVLVDGQRVISDDLNSLPMMAVERIDVLTDGASAIYGSDAIGGVINVILRSEFQGSRLRADYGVSSHGDAKRKSAGFMFGATFDKGNLLAGVSYNQFDKLYQSARKFSKDAISIAGSTNSPVEAFIGGSPNAVRNSIIVPPSVAQQFGCNRLSLNKDAFASGKSPTTLQDYHCFDEQAGDLFNVSGDQLIRTPQERTNLFFKGTFHVTDSIDAYATVYNNQTSAGFELAPPVANQNQGFVLSQYSMFNPFGVEFSRASGNTFQSRELAAGNRFYARSVQRSEGMFGVRGQFGLFGKDWTWDVGYNLGHGRRTVSTAALPKVATLNPFLGPSMLVDGEPACVEVPGDPSTVIAGCTPYDPFNQNAATTKKVLPSAASQGVTTIWSIERVKHADVSGGLFDLPGGTSQLAVGVQWRDEYTNNRVGAALAIDPVTNTCALGGGCTSHLQGGYSVKEAYAEYFMPLLADLPLAYALNVTLGDRYSRYSTFGSTNNWKLGIEYRPFQDLLLRGTVATLFRAPTIGNIFSAPGRGALALSSDPCDHITVANPACEGVPLDGTFENNQLGRTSINTVGAGAQYFGFPLGPEEGKSFDFGAVYSPSYLPGASASVDFWRIYLNNVITSVSGQTIMNLCFTGVSKYCPLIKRYPAGTASAGQILEIDRPTVNLGRIDVSGVDLALNYRLPETWLGQFTVGVNGTYMSEFKIQTAPGLAAGNKVIQGVGLMGSAGSPLQSACPLTGGAGQICFIPRLRGMGRLDWNLGAWNASWRMRYIGGFDLGSRAPSQAYSAVRGFKRGNEYVIEYGSTVYNDLTVGYRLAQIGTRLNLGVKNVFDKQPPLLYHNNSPQGNTDVNDFDLVGRYYWARVTVDF